jgi:ribosomal protein S18 acetylase RimI-like enzyme
MNYEIQPLVPSTLDEFHAFFEKSTNFQGCHCMYWEFPGTNQEWREAESADCREKKSELVREKGSTGYLLYEAGKVIGWCQVGHRSYFEKLNRVEPYRETARDDVFSITCFAIDPSSRKRERARLLLNMVLKKLEMLGVKTVEGYPKPGRDLPDGEVWTGPLSLFLSAGFSVYSCEDDNSLPPESGNRY